MYCQYWLLPAGQAMVQARYQATGAMEGPSLVLQTKQTLYNCYTAFVVSCVLCAGCNYSRSCSDAQVLWVLVVLFGVVLVVLQKTVENVFKEK